MPALPATPLSPSEFFEQFVPRAFAEAPVPEDAEELELALGIELTGEGGGAWTFRVREGALSVEPGSREDAAFSLVLSTDDWRGALWEGRGGLIGQGAAALLTTRALQEGAPGAAGPPAPSPQLLRQLAGLGGLIRAIVAGGEGGDWAVAAKLGPGPLPEEATTTVTIAAEDLQAIASGELDPMQAFMGGKVVVAGDMTLLMQMQALQMQAASQAGNG